MANNGGNTVTVIDGATNATTSVPVGTAPQAVAVNPVTNKIYVANYHSGNVTVIDGATNATTAVDAGSGPWAVAVNPVTGEIYVANYSSSNVTAINEAPRGWQGYVAAPQPLTENNSDSQPEFTLNVTDGHGNPITPLGVYWQIDTMQGSWSAAQANGGNNFSANVSTALTPGSHVLYTYPVKGDVGNPAIDMGTPRMGDVSAYLFTVIQQTGVMTTPAPGSAFTSTTVTFNWAAGPGATAFWLDVGNVPGGNQYYQSGNLGNVLTTTVYGLPIDGSPVYVTLYSLVGGQWLSNAYTYAALNVSEAEGVITTPVPGSTFTGSTVAFHWTAGPGSSSYWLDVGSSPGGNEYYQSGNLGNALTVTVNGLPIDGSAVYVTLYSLVGGQWFSNSYTYTRLQPNRSAGDHTEPGAGIDVKRQRGQL